MITQVRVQNYKALHDVTLDLTPIHVLVGPNDTGKTSLLDAIAAVCRSVDHALAQAFTGSWEERMLVWWRSQALSTTLQICARLEDHTFEYALECEFKRKGRSVTVRRETFRHLDERKAEVLTSPDPRYSAIYQKWNSGALDANEPGAAAAVAVHSTLHGVQYYRWVPRLLGLPVAPDSKVRYRMEASGFGLARCLDDILGYDEERFKALKERLGRIFPEVKGVRLIAEPAYKAPADAAEQVDILARAEGKGVYFRFADTAAEVPAAQVSDGVLLVLAYLAILYLPKPPRVLLVEEPENGIHPKRLQDVLNILRELVAEQSQTQVILTTHSPYVVDLFKPEEVTLCRKGSDGSISVRRLSESRAVREQLDVFTLGEIWTGEGDDALAEPAASHEDPAA